VLVKGKAIFVKGNELMRYIFFVLILVFTKAICAQTTLTIEGKTYTNAEDTWYGVSVPRTVPTNLIFKNNSITSVNRYGYMLAAGDEVLGSNNNNLDGATVSGNILIWNGTPALGIIPHGLFTGYNINVKVKYNYLNKVPMAIIRKSNGMTDLSGAVAYNVLKDPGVGVVVKGMNGVRIYNNTFYSSLTSSQTNRALIEIYENPSVTPPGSATGTKIKNNIFYTKNTIRNISVTSVCLAGFESDYNIFYCEAGTPVFSVDGAQKTFAQWQALGFDTHSVVINPAFKDYVNFVPAVRMDYGTDLGTTFKDGLAVTARWGTTDPETAAQNGKWQVGAMVYKEIVTQPVPVPVYSSSVISDATPAKLEMTYNLTLANIVPASSAFAVRVNSSSRSVSSVAISGTKVLLTLASPVVYGDAVTIAYTKPSTNPLQTTSGGQATSFTAMSVTNNVAAAIPVYVSSVITEATPARLEMIYNLTLANVVPASSAFSVRVNSSSRSVGSVAISGPNVLLTLSSPVAYGDVITIAYTKPSASQLQTVAGGQAASLAAQAVVNNRTAPVNQPPSVTISSPTKGVAFIAPATVNIDVTATDPDGSVSKVEFYNGTVKLGERTAAPWSFTWKEVKEGTYSLTAAATDNANSRKTSAAVTIVVEKAAAAVNQLPMVAISSHTDSDTVVAPATITLTALASDSDGSIIKVEYFNGQEKIGESLSHPWTFSFECQEAGTYEITAKASDNLSATSTSAPVKISVILNREYPDLINLYPNPNNGHFTVDMNEISEYDEESTLAIVSLTGKTVYKDVVSPGEATRQIDITNSLSGNYILIITSRDGILTTRKFIKN